MGPEAPPIPPLVVYMIVGVGLLMILGPIVAIVFGMTAARPEAQSRKQAEWATKNRFVIRAILVIAMLAALIADVVVRARRDAPPVHKELNRDVRPR